MTRTVSAEKPVTAAAVNRARREAIRTVRDSGWAGEIASEVEITDGRFVVRAYPVKPARLCALSPELETGATFDIEAAAQAIRDRAHAAGNA